MFPVTLPSKLWSLFITFPQASSTRIIMISIMSKPDVLGQYCPHNGMIIGLNYIIIVV